MGLRAIGLVAALASAGAVAPALAVDWRHHHADASAPWYDQHPWIGMGVGLYYSQYPDHVPGYPQRLTGTAVPIYPVTTARPAPLARRSVDAHAQWCAGRYRSYDAWSDTWQPWHGPRRQCRSPFG